MINGVAYYLAIDNGYTKLLVVAINLITHQFAYQKEIGGTNGTFNQTGVAFIRLTVK